MFGTAELRNLKYETAFSMASRCSGKLIIDSCSVCSRPGSFFRPLLLLTFPKLLKFWTAWRYWGLLERCFLSILKVPPNDCYGRRLNVPRYIMTHYWTVNAEIFMIWLCWMIKRHNHFETRAIANKAWRPKCIIYSVQVKFGQTVCTFAVNQM